MLPVGCLRLRAKATLARGRRFVPIRFDGAGWFGGLGSVSVAGAPRADPCGALPRRARPRTPPRLSGAKSDPSPHHGETLTRLVVGAECRMNASCKRDRSDAAMARRDHSGRR